ncbi:MAG: hypothetical protein K9M54_04110, partial [Kiritimatiellales bacterium]|nr:hypothetical protein [Kiritimatiellales bacterium]
GGGTAGGVGVDFEFTESSMVSAVVPLGFMGLQPDGDSLDIQPNLPDDCPVMAVRNLRYHGVVLDVTVSANRAKVDVKGTPASSLVLRFNGKEQVIKQAGTCEWDLK